MEKEIENIILNKSFIELDTHEKELISEWASTEDEYSQLKSVFQAADLFKERQNKELNPVIKQRLDVRFKEKYNKERLVWYNKLWLFLWPENSGIVKKPLLQLAAVGLVLLIVTPFLIQNPAGNQHLAMNDQPSKEEVVNMQDKSEEVAQTAEKENELSQKQDDLNSSQPEIDNLSESPVMDAPSEDKDLDFSRLKDVSGKNSGMSGWELNEDSADSETRDDAFVAEDMSVADEIQQQDQAVFAGAVMEQDNLSDRNFLDSESRPAGSKTAKKVDPEKTIDLLTALY